MITLGPDFEGLKSTLIKFKSETNFKRKIFFKDSCRKHLHAISHSSQILALDFFNTWVLPSNGNLLCLKNSKKLVHGNTPNLFDCKTHHYCTFFLTKSHLGLDFENAHPIVSPNRTRETLMETKPKTLQQLKDQSVTSEAGGG